MSSTRKITSNKQSTTFSRGFTLMEVLVSLAVLAIALSALIKSSVENTTNMGYLRDKTFAHWVAMNKATELNVNQTWVSPGRSNGKSEMANQQWHWTMIVSNTPNKNIRKYELEIRRNSTDESPINTLIGYLGKSK